MQPGVFWEPQTAPVTPPHSLPTPSHPRPLPPLISYQAGGTKQSSWVAKHSGRSVCIKKDPSMWLIMPPAHSPPPPSLRHPSMFPAEDVLPGDIPWDGWSRPAVSVLSATIWEEASAGFRSACRRHVLKNVWLPFHWPSRLTGQEASKREREKSFWTPYAFVIYCLALISSLQAQFNLVQSPTFAHMLHVHWSSTDSAQDWMFRQSNVVQGKTARILALLVLPCWQ